jgi:hypothetical protein
MYILLVKTSKALIIYEIWPWNLLFGVNAGVKSLGSDQIYNICFTPSQSCPWGPQDNMCQFVYVDLVGIYLFEAI